MFATRTDALRKCSARVPIHSQPHQPRGVLAPPGFHCLVRSFIVKKIPQPVDAVLFVGKTSPGDSPGRRLALSHFEVLGWDSGILLYGPRGTTNFSLVRFPGDDCLNGETVDLMVHFLSSGPVLGSARILIPGHRLVNLLSTLSSRDVLDYPSHLTSRGSRINRSRWTHSIFQKTGGKNSECLWTREFTNASGAATIHVQLFRNIFLDRYPETHNRPMPRVCGFEVIAP